MKTIFGAIALVIAAPAAAQAAPSTDPHAGHAEHKGMEHGQHQHAKHDCKACCEKMKAKDGKMECREKAEAKPPAGDQHHQGGHAH